MTAWEIMETPLGPLFVGVSAAGVHRIDFVREGRDETWLRAVLNREAISIARTDHCRLFGTYGTDATLASDAVRQISAYFARARFEFELPLVPHGTAFQRTVWSELLTIPTGRTRSYAQVAAAIGRPTAVRAVGQAVGRNPLSLVLPCHRVIGSDGSLTGYAGGIDRKRWLLALEGVSVEGRHGLESGTD